MHISKDRLAFLITLGVALLLFWQAEDLETWSFLGPGPGLFPQIITAACVVVGALLALFPRLADDSDAAKDEPDPGLGPSERRMFLAYCLALPFLAVASAYTGFILTSVILIMGLTWGAERRSWRGALTFGILCGLVGVVGFGHFLGASIPTDELDRIILRLFY